MGVSGTLQTEVMFYVALPFIGLLRRPLAAPLILGGLSLGLEVWLNTSVKEVWLLERLLPFRFWQFVPGW